MTTRFKKSYDALIKAYFEGTLAKGTCLACACANIIADAQGGKISQLPPDKNGRVNFICDTNNSFWSEIFICGEPTSFVDEPFIESSKQDLLDLTGYSWEEMMLVERAFESTCRLNNTHYGHCTQQEILKDQFNGLSAVVDVLCELDNIPNEDKSFNLKFREHPQLA